MKIYTKTGDKGSTSLIGGKRVPKHHPRIEAYGTVDELMAFVALLRDQTEVDAYWKSVLAEVLDRLMSCASILAADCDDCQVRIPSIPDSDIEFLERQMDEMDSQLEPLTSFVLPGGHQVVSLCHVARTICRRAERLTIQLSETTQVPQNLIMYLNRLSDFFFMLSRYSAKNLNILQIPWVPRV
ncbi:MAG: cob(I)yrinic acid a,c-diamide adenosyltransferase [Candidatus Moranbacteria bacterium]|jgi:cob(I)alamin adenosyltransferase|nr:cob(I)yrinic acid a,c-diamide adenosyltransferase [Candidatus Moranbacteria bacterium]